MNTMNTTTTYEATTMAKIEKYTKAGLTEEEAYLLCSPVSALDPQQRMISFAILDKYRENVRKQNDEYDKQKKENNKNQSYRDQIGTPSIVAKTVL